ncbi:MAG: hypothetical protein OXC48_08905, partial [Endozoicomonadaceae bacterium]|nr:hypothetical protein [Endozoicomonadaceae bacterium]
MNVNEHNYLGFNAGSNVTNSLLKDKLFEAPVSYIYKTERDNGLIREIRTYNKYHLMTDEQQISDRTGYILSTAHYFFCRTDKLDGCTQNTFYDLPVTYSLPLKIVTHVWGDKADKPATTITTNIYDSQGRIIKKKDIYGRLIVNHYCPQQGDIACPVSSKEWPFVTLTEYTTLYPAHEGAYINSLPSITTYNYYRREINYNRKGYITVLDHQIEQAGKQHLTVKNYYYYNHKNLLTYGLLKKIIITGKKSDMDSPVTLIKDYYYINSPCNYTKTTYSVVISDKNKHYTSFYTTTSLFTNQLLKTTDTERKYSTYYYYDQWDRLIKTECIAGTYFTASAHYNYTLSEKINQLLITAVNGLQKKVIFDGAGRPLANFTEVVDAAGKQQPDHWRPIQKIYYDGYGRITRKSSYIADQSGQIKTLDTTQDYDDTGRAIRVHLPDGEIAVTRYDDSNRCVISYQQNAQGVRSAISISRANILNKPIRQWVLPATTGLLPSVKSLCLNSDKQPEARVSVIVYDGFGRQIIAQDAMKRVVKQYYDSLGELTDTIDPVGNRMHRVYNLSGQITQSWVYPVSGGHYLMSSAHYNSAGQLIWHAGEDGRRTFYTYTTDGQIATVITPDKHIFSWQYNILNLPVSQSTDNNQQWTVDYTPVTLNLQRRMDITGTTTYAYSDDGLKQQVSHKGKNSYSDYKLQWQYDNNRRLMSVTDISGNKTYTRYDRLGRIASVNYHSYKQHTVKILFMPVYDDFSRTQQINYGSGMHRTFHYDSWGHKDEIKDTNYNQLISQWTMTYDADDNIVTLNQKAENKQYGILHYHYDILNNLVSMQCKGSFGLPLCPHDTSLIGSELTLSPTITRQDYTFTQLNRLASVREKLQPAQQKQTINKITNYYYTDASAPLRLKRISTSWNQNKFTSQHLNYDNAGNMTTDGQNNHITYNALNEIIKIISPTGKQSDYAYNGGGQKVMEKNLNGISYLFYRSNSLINEKIINPQQDIHITGYLNVAKTTDGIINEYYENSYKGDVVGILKKNNHEQYKFYQRNIYSPYGMVWHKNSKALPLYQKTLQGFDNERTDASTGWQFLGTGNRTYNPVQRYFLSEDPAGDGYAFCSNNPIMNTDPSGNSPRWLGEAFKWVGYISTLGLSALHQRWANITAAVIQAGCTVATLGAAVADAGITALAGVIAGTATVSSIPVIAAATPVNRGLNVAGSIIGIAEMAATVAASLGSFMSCAIEEATTESVEAEIPFKMLKSKQGASILIRAEEQDQASGSGIATYPGILVTETRVSEMLSNSASCVTHMNEKSLKFQSLGDVSLTWLALRHTPAKQNIYCDTGCIFLAYFLAEQPLILKKLDIFLAIRKYYLGVTIGISKNHPYIVSLQNMLKRAAYESNSFHIGNYTFQDLRTIIISYGRVVVSGYDHLLLLEKNVLSTLYPHTWTIMEFDNDLGILSRNVNEHWIESSFYCPRFNRTVITGYMALDDYDS